jgi:hypothetical protein
LKNKAYALMQNPIPRQDELSMLTLSFPSKLVGGIDYSTVSVARKRLRIRMEKDVSLKEKFEDCLNKLSSLKI